MYDGNTKDKIRDKTEVFVKDLFENEGSGHDWWHIYRVRNLALKLCEKEGGDGFIIEMAALLHDVDDWKLNGGERPEKARKWMESVDLSEKNIKAILQIIDQVSFKGAGVETKATTIEAEIVQDADRLDAIGAIGIARTFAYGGSKSRLIYHPEIHPEIHSDFEGYKKSTAPTINHFYEKLLLLKDRLNTDTAKGIAITRHTFMEDYLSHFFDEWDNKS